MYNEELLATYSLLSYIRETQEGAKRNSLANVFVPIVKECIAKVLEDNGGKEVKGKDYTEIKDKIKNVFKIEIPIPVLETILPIIRDESEGSFILYRDHSFIIRARMGESIMREYEEQKRRIGYLENHYNAFCRGEGVDPDFNGLITFIQNQKKNLFEITQEEDISDQNYHISKYIDNLIKKKDSHFEIVCDLYLGGIIASYLRFQVRERVLDTELLVDTNFYISLVDLNTEESYATCKQLYDLTVSMGCRYKILETTIEQIRILLSNKELDYGNRSIMTAVNPADILAACERRGLSHSDLQAYKDSLLEDLSRKGISTLYKSNIPSLVDTVRKKRELKTLTYVRGNEDSAFNDLLAIEYVNFKRSNHPITEFGDVNSWFLTNSYSINKTDLSLPIWERPQINASDLLVLLWYANPSLPIGNEKTLLTVTSLSANVLKYRTEKRPSEAVSKKLINKVMTLQQSNHVTEVALAKLCLRMAEGCIDKTEAERIVALPTGDLLDYIKKIQDQGAAYADVVEEKEELERVIKTKNKDALNRIVLEKINARRGWSVVYVLGVIALFVVMNVTSLLPSPVLKLLVNFVCFILTTFVVNWFSHSFFLEGLASFFNRDRIYNKLLKQELNSLKDS